MGSHSVTYHPVEVNDLHCNPSHTRLSSIHQPQKYGRLSWPILHNFTQQAIIGRISYRYAKD